MKLLQEVDPLHPDDPPRRGEYRIVHPHLLISCPECGGVTMYYRTAFDGRFKCRFAVCGHSDNVKLTGERA